MSRLRPRHAAPVMTFAHAFMLAEKDLEASSTGALLDLKARWVRASLLDERQTS